MIGCWRRPALTLTYRQVALMWMPGYKHNACLSALCFFTSQPSSYIYLAQFPKGIVSLSSSCFQFSLHPCCLRQQTAGDRSYPDSETIRSHHRLGNSRSERRSARAHSWSSSGKWKLNLHVINCIYAGMSLFDTQCPFAHFFPRFWFDLVE